MNISSTESGNDADCVDIYLPENIVSTMVIVVFKLKQIFDVVYSLSE